MKTLRLNVRYSGFILFCAAVAAFTFQHCDCTGGKPLVEIKEPIKAPHGVAFIDANGVNTNVQKVKVTLIDTLGQVVSSNGIPFKSVQVDGGVMSIGLSSKAQFNVENPYLFYIKAEADGYMTVIKSVVIAEDAPNYVPIYMTNLNNLPPSGLAASVGNFPSVSAGLLQDNLVLTTKSSNQVPVLTLALRKGTQLLYDGKPVDNQGALNYQLLFGIPGDANANRAFPGGFEVSNAVNADGKPLADPANPFFFTTGGWFTLEMNVGGVPVNGFSQPVDVEMPIGDTVINPASGKPVQMDDDFPIWSMDDRTGVWRQEGTAKVEAGANGGLAVRFPVRHLSTFNADFPGPLCSTGTARIDLSYTHDVNNVTGFSGSRFSRLVNTADGSDIKAKIVNYDNTGNLEMIRLPAGVNMQLLVHRGAGPENSIQGVSNAPLTCPGTGTLSVVGSTPGSCILLEFVTGGANTPITTQCYNSVWTKNNCADAASMYMFEGILNCDGNVVVPNYPGNKCVGLWFLDQATNEQVYLEFTINFGMALNTNITGTGNTNTPVANSSFTFTARKEASGGTCTNRIRVNIPGTLISGNPCPNPCNN